MLKYQVVGDALTSTTLQILNQTVMEPVQEY